MLVRIHCSGGDDYFYQLQVRRCLSAAATTTQQTARQMINHPQNATNPTNPHTKTTTPNAICNICACLKSRETFKKGCLDPQTQKKKDITPEFRATQFQGILRVQVVCPKKCPFKAESQKPGPGPPEGLCASRLGGLLAGNRQ